MDERRDLKFPIAQNLTQFLERFCARDEILSPNRDPPVSILVAVLSEPSKLFRAVDVPLGDLVGLWQSEQPIQSIQMEIVRIRFQSLAQQSPGVRNSFLRNQFSNALRISRVQGGPTARWCHKLNLTI